MGKRKSSKQLLAIQHRRKKMPDLWWTDSQEEEETKCFKISLRVNGNGDGYAALQREGKFVQEATKARSIMRFTIENKTIHFDCWPGNVDSLDLSAVTCKEFIVEEGCFANNIIPPLGVETMECGIYCSTINGKMPMLTKCVLHLSIFAYDVVKRFCDPSSFPMLESLVLHYDEARDRKFVIIGLATNLQKCKTLKSVALCCVESGFMEHLDLDNLTELGPGAFCD